jgi:small subunit ribosomal protein S9
MAAEKLKTIKKSGLDSKEKVLKVPSLAYYGTGKRKCAIAKVWIFDGDGQLEVNSKAPLDYLCNEILVNTAFAPISHLGLDKNYSIKVSTFGGGLVGQADAIQLGVARALLSVNETFREKLKALGFITRDPRVKERKKYGRKKARKGYQFRKR